MLQEEGTSLVRPTTNAADFLDGYGNDIRFSMTSHHQQRWEVVAGQKE